MSISMKSSCVSLTTVFCVTIVEDYVYFYEEPVYVKVLANFLYTSLHSYNTVFATKLNMGKNITQSCCLVANRNVMAVTAGSNMLILSVQLCQS